jgi:hypothetical protein
VRFLTRQIGELVAGLKKMGLYDAATVIIHGDHGSRLRLLRSADQQVRDKVRNAPGSCPIMSRYDYAGEPDSRDLLNRFSVLLAIKRPASKAPVVIAEPGSVVFFLQRAFSPGSETRDGVNSVYLFDPDGSPRRIDTMAKAFVGLPPESASANQHGVRSNNNE